MAVSLLSVNVPGSHSNVISSAWFHELVAFSLFTRPLSCLTERNDGVPPPKYTKSSRRPAIRLLFVVQLPLARQHVQIRLDLAGVLPGVDTEVAEMAPLPAERNMKIQAQRDIGGYRRERRLCVCLDRVLRPQGERRVVGDEIAANVGLIGCCDRRDLCHKFNIHRN